MLLTRIVPIALILASIIFAMADELWAFIDARSWIMVLVPAIAYGFSGSGNWNSQDRLRRFSHGAVFFGWLGSLIGAVLISNGLDDLNALGPATSIALLTILYGYIVQATIGVFLTDD